jgi:hypothetical protein
MIDRALAPRFVVAARVGRTDVGEATVTIDEDTLILAVHDASADRTIRIPLSTIDAVVLRDGEMVASLRNGRTVTFAATNVSALSDEILSRCRALPELTHALRAFGSRRGHRSTRAIAAADQQRFFAVLLDARRRAMGGLTSLATMAAFDADALAKAFETELRVFAAERYSDHAPARRALEAELIDLSEPLQAALDALGHAARDAAASVDDLRLWRAWTRQLRATFEVADRVWLSLDVALDSNPWTL